MKKLFFILTAVVLCLALSTTEAQAQAVSQIDAELAMKANEYKGAFLVKFVTRDADISRVNNTFNSESARISSYSLTSDAIGRRHTMLINMGASTTEEDVKELLDSAGIDNIIVLRGF